MGTHPQFSQVARMVAQQPHILPQMLQALTASNPELLQAIQENPEGFQQLLQEMAAGGGGGAAEPPANLDPVETMLYAAQQALGGGGGGGGGSGGPRPMQVH